MSRTWENGEFNIATITGVAAKKGATCEGLGLFKEVPFGYSLTHLRSGLALCYLDCEMSRAKILAGRFLDVGDWTRTKSRIGTKMLTSAAALIDKIKCASRFGIKCAPLTAKQAAPP